MKPERLFQMMDEISPDYIAEGKPAFTRTRPAKQHTPRQNPAQEEVFLSVQKPVQKRRKENTLKGSVIQRLTTGLVAAAALTVFVGTGVFIAKQEKDKQALSSAVPAAEIAEQTTKNFLGGTGELRTLQPILGLNINRIIYDNDFLYFNDSVNSPAGIYRVPRNSPQQTEDTFQEIGFNDDLWATDNGQFFVCDGGKLYAIAQGGTKTLFFDAAQINLQADFEIKDYVYLNIKHICDDAYVFYFHALDNIAEGGANKLQKCACLYHAESNKIEILENSLLNDMNWEYLLPDGKNGFYVCAAAPQNGSPQLYHYTVGETVTKTGLFDEDTVIVPSSMYLSPDGGTLYFCSEYNSTLRKFDLNAGGESTVVLNEVPSQDYQYVVNDGTVSYFHSGCKEICCSDLEWTTHEVLWSADDSKLPAELAKAYQSEKTLHWLPLGVDDNYLYVSFSSDAPETVGILDRKTGEMRYLKFDYESNKLTEEGTQQQTAQNFLGGTGEIKTMQAKPGIYSGIALYDNESFYLGFENTVPRDKNQQTTRMIDRNQKCAIRYDGERFYLHEDTKLYLFNPDGSRTEFFDAAQLDLNTSFRKNVYTYFGNGVRHICDDVYLIAFLVQELEETVSEDSYRFCTCIYHSDTKQTEILENTNDSQIFWEKIVPDGKNGFYALVKKASASTSHFYHYTIGETTEKTGFFSESVIIEPDSLYLSQDGSTLYFRTHDTNALRKIDLNDASKSTLVRENLPTSENPYVIYDNKTYAFSPDGKEIRCSDLEWNGYEVLWKAEDSLPAEYYENPALWYLFAVDDNYIYLNAGSDTRYGILDRKTGEMRYLKYDLENEKLTEEGTEQQTEESSVQEAASSLAAQK